MDTLEMWNAVAPGWERYRDRLASATAPVTEWMLDRLALKSGDTVLDVAAGPGELSLLAATKAGPSGRVICTDFSPNMVDAARRAVEAAGLTNVECRVMDAQSMDLADDSVDAALCRFGLMLMPDPVGAMRETRRVLRSGGRFAFAVWGPPEENHWIVVTAVSLMARGLLPPADPSQPGGIFSLSDGGRLRELCDQGGFGAPEVEEIRRTHSFASIDEMWDFQSATAGPLAQAMNSLSDEQAAEVKAEIETNCEPYRTSEGFELPGLALVVATQ